MWGTSAYLIPRFLLLLPLFSFLCPSPDCNDSTATLLTLLYSKSLLLTQQRQHQCYIGLIRDYTGQNLNSLQAVLTLSLGYESFGQAGTEHTISSKQRHSNRAVQRTQRCVSAASFWRCVSNQTGRNGLAIGKMHMEIGKN